MMMSSIGQALRCL